MYEDRVASAGAAAITQTGSVSTVAGKKGRAVEVVCFATFCAKLRIRFTSSRDSLYLPSRYPMSIPSRQGPAADNRLIGGMNACVNSSRDDGLTPPLRQSFLRLTPTYDAANIR